MTTVARAKAILWEHAGMGLHSDHRITMEPETFIACIRDALSTACQLDDMKALGVMKEKNPCS